MKSVLLSIKPKWCELIVKGEKTVEVRKTRPKIETPFKCYIYCTKPKTALDYIWSGVDGTKVGVLSAAVNGKVIGEFLCEHIDRMAHCGTNNNNIKLRFVDNYYFTEIAKEYLYKCQLSYFDLEKYSNGGDIYGWRISDLKIYDEPKKLSEFGLTRPPQSWCYVKEI